MSRFPSDDPGGIYYRAHPDAVVGFGGRGVAGLAYRWSGGYLFKDDSGDSWWIIFQPSADAGVPPMKVRGEVLACSASPDDLVHVRVLASGVLEVDADAAFRDGAPATLEEAVQAAAGIPALKA